MNIVFEDSFCFINTRNIANNYLALKQFGNHICVVKSDAYGHGISKVTKTLLACGANFFAVGCVDEGVKVRRLSNECSILVLRPILSTSSFKLAIDNSLIPIATSFDTLELISLFNSSKFSLAIKIDTGMGRLGFTPEQVPHLIQHLKKFKNIQSIYLISHYSSADDSVSYSLHQTKVFNAICSCFKDCFSSLKKSIGNSSALYNVNDSQYDFYRIGILLYGHCHIPANNPYNLKPAMSLCAPIISIKNIRSGDYISYNRTYKAKTDLKVAVASIGYKSGLPRTLSNKLKAEINGKIINQIGMICMEMCMFDVTNINNIKLGQYIRLFGGDLISIEEFSKQQNTIPYEIFCTYGKLNKKIYI